VIYSLEYLLQKIDEGFDFDFIAKDAGVDKKSIYRRLLRAEKKGLLDKRYIDIYKRYFSLEREVKL
jgi:hypothetical protein